MTTIYVETGAYDRTAQAPAATIDGPGPLEEPSSIGVVAPDVTTSVTDCDNVESGFE